MRTSLLVFSLLFMCLVLNAQEDCFNGIDDDGDGDIDLNDTNCICTDNLVNNGTFDGPCDPPIATPPDWDSFFNGNYALGSACSTNYDMTPGPPPLPATELVQITTSGLIGSANIYQCLNQTMVAGQTYTMSYDYAITSGALIENDPPDNSFIYIYGIPSCPSDYVANPAYCGGPPTIGNMVLLDINTFPAIFDVWENYQFSITPSQNIEGIAISGPCWSFEIPYMLTQLSNIDIDGGTPIEEVEDPFFSDGSSCSQLTVSADLSTVSIPNPTIQWFLDGIAIAGATAIDYIIPQGTEGSLSFALTNPGSCGVSESILIPEITILDVQGTAVDNPCFGDEAGFIDLNILNGNPDFTYNWSNGATTSMIENLADGSYSVTVTDSDGCTGEQQFMIETPFIVDGNIINVFPVDPVSGFGSATVQVTGGAPDFTFLWDNGETTAIATQLEGGFHTVTLTDANGCTLLLEVEIPYIALTVTETSNSPSCGNECAGEAVIFIAGGLQPYDINWEDAWILGTQVDDLCPGSYAYTVTDAIGNEIIGVTEIEGLSVPIINAEVVQPECGAQDGGEIVVTPSGNGPFSYDWDNGSNSPILFNIGPGNYTLTLTDSNGCMVDSTFIINAQAEFLVDFTIEYLTCEGDTNGSILVEIAFEDVNDYSFDWSTGETTNELEDLGAGTYEVTITQNDSGCQKIESFEVSVFIPSPVYSLQDSPVLCSGEVAEIGVVLENQSDYSILWADGSTDLIKDVNESGQYEFSLTSQFGCVIDTFIQVDFFEKITISTLIQSPVCAYDSMGSIILENISGDAPFDILWSDGSDGDTLITSAEGDFALTITDSNGCQVVADFEIQIPEPLDFLLTGTEFICEGDDNGTIALVIDEDELYTLMWDDGSDALELNDLSSGNYGITVTDENGCQYLDSFSIGPYSELTFEVNTTDETCNGENDGFVLLSQFNLPINTVLWNDGATEMERANLSPGAYSYIVEDANGCSYENAITILPGYVFDVEFEVVQLTCDNDMASIMVINSDAASFDFIWNGAEVAGFIEIEEPGIVDLEIIHLASGCSLDTSFVISPIISSEVGSTVIDASCDIANASISLTGDNIDEYSILWSTMDVGTAIYGLEAGDYSASLTDNDGCVSILEFDVLEIPKLEYDISKMDVLCKGEQTGTIVIGPGDIFEDIRINSQPGSALMGNLGAGLYVIDLIDINGCESTEVVTITEPETALSITIDLVVQIDENNDRGAIEVSASGGTSPYEYLWDTGATTSSIDNLESGFYEVTVTDVNGCTMNTRIEITEEIDEPLSATYEVTDNECFSECLGSIEVFISGGIAPFTILVYDSEGQSVVNGELCAGRYEVEIIDANENQVILNDVFISEPSEVFYVGIQSDFDTLYAVEGEVIDLIAEVNFPDEDLQVTWYFEDEELCQGDFENCGINTIIANAEGTINLYAENQNGCVAQDEIYISIAPKSEITLEIVIPNIINPFSNGNNTIWTFYPPPNLISMETSIYDRWGNAVFISSDIPPRWDGTFNGRRLNSGVYVYIIKYALEGDDELKVKGGDVTVIY
ncbi:MAG: gliding motility-associated C-terminal domain-containing protein [Saprospiraceae bacterium]|nr:gliding motility-associated C-terminal domain-containing protein [Saprospiraceae bacterium]